MGQSRFARNTKTNAFLSVKASSMSSGPGAKPMTAAQKAKIQYGLEDIDEAPAKDDSESAEESD